MTSDVPQIPLYQHILFSLFDTLGVNDSVYHILRFLKEYIPCDRILCFSVDRCEKVLNTIIDYSNTQIRNIPDTKLIRSVLTWDEIYSCMQDSVHFISRIDDVKSIPMTKNYLAKNLQVSYSSMISSLLDINEKEDNLFCVMLFSEQKSQFSHEHEHILVQFRPLLQKLLLRFFQSSHEPYLLLADAGPVFASSEILLRRCKGLRKVMRQVDVVANKDTLVLLRGASGSGKELVAETIHMLSPWQEGPLIKVNCGSIPETLLDSELFGHEKGAFTGANASVPGYFEQAQGGTLYLDEIGEISPQAQVRLLRVLESGEIRRVGGTRRIPLNVRVVVATHRDLWAMTQQGTFREDLWYRLNIYPITLPSLDQRLDDIPVLAEYFYSLYAKRHRIEYPPRLSHHFVRQLTLRSWPGNVRELRYAMERALLESDAAGLSDLELAEQDKITAEPSPFSAQPSSQSGRRGRPGLDANAAAETRAALARSGGCVSGLSGAAALLGLSPTTVRHRMKVLGIVTPKRKRVKPGTDREKKVHDRP